MPQGHNSFLFLFLNDLSRITEALIRAKPCGIISNSTMDIMDFTYENLRGGHSDNP